MTDEFVTARPNHVAQANGLSVSDQWFGAFLGAGRALSAGTRLSLI